MAAEVEIIINATDNASSTLGNFGSILTGIESAINLVGRAFDAAYGFITPFIDSATESQDAIADLEATLRSTNSAAGMTSQELQDMASSFQNLTRFSDEAIISGEAMLLTFTSIGADVFPMATEAMLNLAEKFGSIDSAAVQLGKALNDPINGVTALRRVGVQLTDQQEEAIKKFVELGDIESAQKVILSELETEFGGLAVAMGTTFAGQLEITKNKLDEIKESIGNALLPILGDLLDKFNEFVESPAVQNFLKTLTDALTTGDFSSLWDMLLNSFNNIDWEQVSRNFADALNNINWDVVSEGFGGISDAFTNILIEIDWSAVAGAIWESLIQAFMVVIDTGADALIKLLADAFGDPDVATFQAGVKGGMERLGGLIVEGLINGIRAALGPVLLPFETFLNSVYSLFGINSPSTVFFDIGKNIVLGLIGGMVSMFDFLVSAVEDLVLTMLGPIQPLLDALGIDLGGATGTTGSHDTGMGGTTGGHSGTWSGGTGTTTGSEVTNNFYGPVYFGDMGQLGYDCPSPNPLLSSTSMQMGGL